MRAYVRPSGGADKSRANVICVFGRGRPHSHGAFSERNAGQACGSLRSQTVAARRYRAKSPPVERFGATSIGVKPDDNVAAQGRRDCDSTKAKIIRGGRMPPLPIDDAKMIVRPEGGVNIRKVGQTVVAEVIWKVVGIDPTKRDSDTMARSGSSVSQQMKYTLSWAYTVSGGGGTGPSRSPRDQLSEQASDAEVARLRKKNADLKEMVIKMSQRNDRD
ncbi:hypothetical protein HPB50_017040 [Hyalomma asiaticum]|uniref:Uncharacterized protein n=1 Tax=Hyalomma asiaticum TaxID=266040 RepID=A0ACB7TJD3_HYAAI|nr:hypothetical protein HPB50_017040 [Hyalomma asiaticum]